METFHVRGEDTFTGYEGVPRMEDAAAAARSGGADADDFDLAAQRGGGEGRDLAIGQRRATGSGGRRAMEGTVHFELLWKEHQAGLPDRYSIAYTKNLSSFLQVWFL